MKILTSFPVSANHTRVINLCEDMELNSGIKKIALSASDDGIFADENGNFLTVPNYKNGVAHYEFPIIDGNSPCTFKFMNKNSSPVRIFVTVEELGGNPSSEYFE